MKNKTSSFLVSCLCFALVGNALAAQPATQPGPPSPDTVARINEKEALTKERDEAKASLAALQSQQQLQNLATEFYKASSEKNAALLQLVSALQQLETAQKELAAVKNDLVIAKFANETARAEIETLKAAKK